MLLAIRYINIKGEPTTEGGRGHATQHQQHGHEILTKQTQSDTNFSADYGAITWMVVAS